MCLGELAELPLSSQIEGGTHIATPGYLTWFECMKLQEERRIPLIADVRQSEG